MKRIRMQWNAQAVIAAAALAWAVGCALATLGVAWLRSAVRADIATELRKLDDRYDERYVLRRECAPEKLRRPAADVAG